MRILVLPVSGGRFPVQLVFLKEIIKIGYKPDIILATSGGNICAYLSVISDFELRTFEILLREISSDLLIKERTSISFLSKIIGFFKGSIYLASEKNFLFMKEIYQNYRDKEDIKKYEVWSGTYNVKKQKAQFFCNRTKEESILDKFFFSNTLNIYPILEPRYLNGEIEMISKIITSSAALPGYIEKQIIEGEEFLDGGLSSASPLTYLIDILNENLDELEIIYLNSLDDNKENNFFLASNIVENWKKAADDLIRSLISIDKLQALKLFKRKEKIEVFKFNHDEIENAMEIAKKNKKCFLEFYPLKWKELEIGMFSNKEIQESMKVTENNFSLRLLVQKD